MSFGLIEVDDVFVPEIEVDEGDVDESVDDQNGDGGDELASIITMEENLRRKQIEKAPMQTELKLLEKRWTKSGISYLIEPQDVDDLLPEEQINWHEKFALCVGYLPMHALVGPHGHLH
jgi:hypothetical protein